MQKKQPISDERAVETGQLGQPAQTNAPQANVGHYEPHQLTQLNKHGRLYIIADGVSGATSGHVASQYAIQKILRDFYSTDAPEPQARLQAIIRQVNQEIYRRNAQQPERRPMAITLTAALLHKNKLFVANVGDNKAYVVWGQDIERVEWDAAPPPPEPPDAPVLLLPAQAASGAGSRESPPNKNKPQARVPQVLGLEEDIKIDTFTRRLFPADIVILCSGGLSGYLTEKEIARAVSRYSPEDAIPRLAALAAERGNRDPMAISITRVLSSAVALRPPKPMPLPEAPAWSDWDDLPAPSTPETKPEPPKTEEKSASATQPLPPAPSSRPQPASSLFSFEEPTRWRWRSCALGIALVLLLCALPVLAWRYLLPANIKAAVPFLSNAETLVAGSLGLSDPTATGVAIELPPGETTPPSQTEQTEPAATGEARATAPAASATEPNSSVATPESAFVSPVSPVSPPSPPTATPTPTPAQPPTPSPTPLPTIALPEDCTNRARFLGDVTVPDGATFAPGEPFEKMWQLLNAETCPWGPGYTVRFIGGDPMGAEPVIPLTEEVPSKANGEIRVPMVAPTTPGQYRGEWQLHDLTGESFGPVMYLEIEVTPPDLSALAESDATVLYDFIAKADEATWSAEDESYPVEETEIDETLPLPLPEGYVARGIGLLRGNQRSQNNVLLTYPHRQFGVIEGVYAVNAPLEPTDALVIELGFPKLSILSDDGVTFEVIFTPEGGEPLAILSRNVLYQDSPVSEIAPLAAVEPGQSGSFTLRVLGRESLSQDWAVWIQARIIRP